MDCAHDYDGKNKKSIQNSDVEMSAWNTKIKLKWMLREVVKRNVDGTGTGSRGVTDCFIIGRLLQTLPVACDV